ncbi:MAG TPA: FHA domain-containing protein [Kofleriaceae bacterium]|nr:FHA domain-containing protein [Kofleriaceae bacterium]
MTLRFVLINEGQRILLPFGETLIGRSLTCGIRFNDAAISREHLRILVAHGRAEAVNLSSNGTLLNGDRLQEPSLLKEGDELQVGYRRLRVEILEEIESPRLDLKTRARAHAARRSTDKLPAQPRSPAPAPSPPPAANPETTTQELILTAPSRIADIRVQSCPSCHAPRSVSPEDCPSCGTSWPAGHPSARTQDIDPELALHRREPRYPVVIPVVYSSATLTIHAVVRDLSRGGMFIATGVLDPIGTPCEVTALPDGHRPLSFSGLVAHVSGEPSLERTCGFGIRIVGGSRDALRWLAAMIERLAGTTVDMEG